MRLKAKAKINLFLNICGRRDDNYHLINSLIIFAEQIYDEITINLAQKNSVEIIGGEFCNQLRDQKNIIDLAFKYLNLKGKYNIKLQKNLPIAAGIGGGSSNVATVIKYLIKQENILLNQNQIDEICIKIGADVPICYRQKSAYVNGIGEKIFLCEELPKLWLVIVNPNKQILAKEIYNMGFTHYREHMNFPKNFSSKEEFVKFIIAQENDMEKNAIKIVPQIKDIISKIKQTENNLLSRMSGSGATCFGLYENANDAMKAENNLKNIFKNFWIRSSSFI